MPQPSAKVEISHRTVIFSVLLILGILLVYRIWDILLQVFVSLILMAALKPAVDFFEKLKLSRGLSVVVTYIIFWSFFTVLIASIIPPLIDQTKLMIQQFPPAVSNIQFLSDHQQEITSQLLSTLGSLPENILKLIISVFGNLLTLFTTTVMTFYFLVDRKNLGLHLANLSGKRSNHRWDKILDEVEAQLGHWVRGELLLMFAVGLLSYIGLKVLGIETALPLAIIAGILEAVPNVGPVISAVPAVLIAFLIHPFLAVSTAALYFIVQFMENNFLVPKIMQQTTGVHPILSIVGLMVGFRLAGPVGAVFAIPTILVLQTIGFRVFTLSNLEKIAE